MTRLSSVQVPGLPIRQALPVLLDKWHADCDDVVTALAAGLAQGYVTEWQHAVSMLLPVFASKNLLPELPVAELVPDPCMPCDHVGSAAGMSPVISPALGIPQPTNFRDHLSGRAAHCLLRAMITHRASWSHCQKVAANRCTEDVYRSKAVFATAFAKWLSSNADAAVDPLSLAHLLGVTVRASRESPPSSSDRYFVTILQVQRRLLEVTDSD